MSEETTNNSSWSLRGPQIASLIAVIVSISALFVSVYEARIMARQQDVMVSQQKMSVWPYVKGGINLNLDTAQGKITLLLENKGIGPAIIRGIRLDMDQTEVESYSEILTVLESKFMKNTFALSTASFNEFIIPANESYTLISIVYPRFPNDYQILSDLNINFEICYCSVYNDCWMVNAPYDQVTCAE